MVYYENGKRYNKNQYIFIYIFIFFSFILSSFTLNGDVVAHFNAFPIRRWFLTQHASLGLCHPLPRVHFNVASRHHVVLMEVFTHYFAPPRASLGLCRPFPKYFLSALLRTSTCCFSWALSPISSSIPVNTSGIQNVVPYRTMSYL